MEMPNKVEINEKTKTLTVYVDCQPYEFQNSDYFKSDNGKILLKHQSVMLLAELTNTKVGPPSLLSNYNPVIYVLARTAERDGVSYTGIGETNAKTLFSDIMKKNPATTADNRAYERAVLGVLGLYGFIYGSSEINYKDGENKTPPASKNKSEKDNKTEEVKAETKTEDGQEPETAVQSDSILQSENVSQTSESKTQETKLTLTESDAAKPLAQFTVSDTTSYRMTDVILATHVLESGETLAKISLRYYGTKKLWPYIAAYNKITDANSTSVGMNLKIPVLVRK